MSGETTGAGVGERRRMHNRCGLGDAGICGHPDCPDMQHVPAEPDAGDVEAGRCTWGQRGLPACQHGVRGRRYWCASCVAKEALPVDRPPAWRIPADLCGGPVNEWVEVVRLDHLATLLDRARREGEAEGLRAAADQMAGGSHSCFRPQGCVECGRQKEREGRAKWLRGRADNLGGTP